LKLDFPPELEGFFMVREIFTPLSRVSRAFTVRETRQTLIKISRILIMLDICQNPANNLA
jgi:hypothetical protein